MDSGTASAQRAEVRRPQPVRLHACPAPSSVPTLGHTAWLHLSRDPGQTSQERCGAGTLSRAPSPSHEDGPAGQAWRPDYRGQMGDTAPVHMGPCPPLMGPPDRPPTPRKPGLCVLVQRDMETETGGGAGWRGPWIAPRPSSSLCFLKLLFLIIK